MTTEYRVRLDRDACDGVFACLVRDDRFVEAADGLARIDASGGDDERVGSDTGGGHEVVRFSDDRLGDAEQAARACPVDAIEVLPGAAGASDDAATEGDDA